MTAHPDVLSPDERVDAAWASLTAHHYRHLPVVDGDAAVGVVSLRDLMGVARIRPAVEQQHRGPRRIGGGRGGRDDGGRRAGAGGLLPLPAVLRRRSGRTAFARRRLAPHVPGELPGRAASAHFADKVRSRRQLPAGLASLLPALARRGTALEVLRSAVSVLGAELGWRPTLDIDAAELSDQALGLCAVVPTILAAADRLRAGLAPVAPRDDLDFAANYLYMLTGDTPSAAHARAIEQYMILTIDHGFNASTFAGRVITSTGADLGAAIVGAIGALSGPLHGGAPSRALDMLDEIGTPDRAEAFIRPAIERGERIMGFGHRVYKTDDPRSLFLRSVVEPFGGPLVELAVQVERTVVDVLAELKPGRHLYTNVEFYACVVMDLCGIERHLFTPTFAAGRTIGWSTHVMEQAAHNRLIRPSARYVGPPPPQPVPAAD